jgi:phenylacetate-coenzyme A ligase PaaK-like adenylate-forming protein
LDGSRGWRDRLGAAGLSARALLGRPLEELGDWPGLSREELSRDPLPWLALREGELEGMYAAWSSGSSGQGPLAVPRFDVDGEDRLARFAEAARARGVDLSSARCGAFLCALPGRPEPLTWLGQARTVPVQRLSLLKDGWAERLCALAPDFWTLSPAGLARVLASGASVPSPRVVLSTALQLPGELRREAERRLRCPVVDLFSTAETGPFAAGCPADGRHFHVLTGGAFVRVDAGGLRVTRLGDSPLPLLNYLVADRAAGLASACPSCRHSGPTLLGLTGRTLSEKGEHSTAAFLPRAPAT